MKEGPWAVKEKSFLQMTFTVHRDFGRCWGGLLAYLRGLQVAQRGELYIHFWILTSWKSSAKLCMRDIRMLLASTVAQIRWRSHSTSRRLCTLVVIAIAACSPPGSVNACYKYVGNYLEPHFTPFSLLSLLIIFREWNLPWFQSRRRRRITIVWHAMSMGSCLATQSSLASPVWNIRPSSIVLLSGW